jgi:hypothetical protein
LVVVALPCWDCPDATAAAPRREVRLGRGRAAMLEREKGAIAATPDTPP